VLAVTGITNNSLRALMTGPLGRANYTMNQASYDLARLRTNGLITRIPGKNRYRLTGDGPRFAIFYTKLHACCCVPYSLPTSHPHRDHSEMRCTPSTFTSQKPSTKLACRKEQPKNGSRQLSKF
jgi:hypothetical protein